VPLAVCLDNVQRFVDQGGQELVLSGINLGRWGRDLSQPQRFEDLVAAILTETRLPRLRLSSIEPMDWSQDLLALYAEFAAGDHPRLARHAHLPLQSGSDTILRRMYRRYRPWHYAERLAAIRDLMPDAAIGADVMIGFPGETDDLFEESYCFIAEQPFTYLHLFPFSARPSTPAWELHRQQPVADQVVRRRMQALRDLMTEKFRAFRSSLIGHMLSAVTIEAGPEATTAAVTDNFLKLTLNETLPANRLVAARITSLTVDGLGGTTAPMF
jgi:threonylcarbamoyladenosine tRNA methylthiotransferase MtaB